MNNNKKTTLSTKVKSTDVKVSKPKKVANSSNNFDAVMIQKFVDNKGVSLRNQADVARYQKNGIIDKTSKYGVTPVVAYDGNTNFRKDFKRADIVRPTDTGIWRAASWKAARQANDLSRQAVDQYESDINRSNLNLTKNLAIARINALRVLTKAAIIEKNHHEQVYEKKCHDETVKNIDRLRIAMIQKNDYELAEVLVKLKHDFELELRNNESDYLRAKVRIEEKQAIFQLKRKAIRDQIKTLNEGKSLGFWTTYIGRKTPKSILLDIKRGHYIPANIKFNSEDTDADSFIKQVKRVDPKKLSSAEAKVWGRFIELLEHNEAEEKYAIKLENVEDNFSKMEENIKEIKDNTIMLAKSKKLVLVANTKGKDIVAAAKHSLSISKPASLYAAPVKLLTSSKVEKTGNAIVKTKVIRATKPAKVDTIGYKPLEKIPYEETAKLSHIPNEMIVKDQKSSTPAPKKMGFEKNKETNALEVDKMKLETIEYTNYKWEWKDANKDGNMQSHWFDPQHNAVSQEIQNFNISSIRRGPDAPRNIRRLQQAIDSLPKDPIVVMNQSAFRKENISLINTIEKFKKIDSQNFEDNEANNAVVDDVAKILNIYRELCRQDMRQRQNVLKAQKFDQELTLLMARQDRVIANLQAVADSNYVHKLDAIEDQYVADVENSKNQHLINKESILQQEQDSLAKEEEAFLWNSSLYFKTSNDYANAEYQYENGVISSLIKTIEKFNRRSENPISISNIPSKICPMPVTSNARIDISFETIGSTSYAVAANADQRNKLMVKINSKNIPAETKKIYVLDKFKAIKDIKTRVALLNEIARVQFDKEVKNSREVQKREIAQAKAKLEKRLAKIEVIYNDAELIEKSADLLDIGLAEVDKIQNQYISDKIESWKIFEKEQREKARISRQNELQYLKQQREKDRIADREYRYQQMLEARNNTAVANRAPKGSKNQLNDDKLNKFTMKLDEKNNNYKAPKHGFSLFGKRKNDISIDEIIGKTK